MKRREGRGAVRFTASEVAGFFSVDPKTIRNWVLRGALRGEETPGGHLRVRRSAVLDAARTFGLPVPRAVTAPPLRVAVALASPAARALAERALTPPATFVVLGYEHPLDALVDCTRAEPEVLVIDPDEASALLGLAAERLAALKLPALPPFVAFSEGGATPAGYRGGASHAAPGSLRAAVLAAYGLGAL